MTLRIVIAEDAAMMRQGLAHLLVDRGCAVVAEVADGEALLRAVARHRPDAAVVDIRMPPTFTDEGVRAALALRDRHPDVGLLLFSQYIETRFAGDLLARGAAGIGYLLKDRVADTSEFVDALTRVAAGGTALDPEVVGHLLAARDRTRAIRDRLTPRERQVLELMAEGRSNAAIAARLAVNEGTVEKHVASLFAKLDLPTSHDDNRRVLAVLRYLRR